MTLENLGRRDDGFALLARASHDRLKDLRRQPDLADFVRDPRFGALFEQSNPTSTNSERKK